MRLETSTAGKINQVHLHAGPTAPSCNVLQHVCNPTLRYIVNHRRPLQHTFAEVHSLDLLPARAQSRPMNWTNSSGSRTWRYLGGLGLSDICVKVTRTLDESSFTRKHCCATRRFQTREGTIISRFGRDVSRSLPQEWQGFTSKGFLASQTFVLVVLRR